MISYGKQWIDDDDVQSVIAALTSDWLTQGPAISQFEKDLCAKTGARFCVAVSNGTAALHIAVAALNIEPGKNGITSPNSFVASANCLLYNHLRPRFADIEPDTYNICPKAIERAMNPDTRVIIPVDFAGQPADLESIWALAQNRNCHVIEDACHALGSRYANGSPVGSCAYSDMTVFSFHPVKTITTGEGGAITTNDPHLYERLLALRSHGITKNVNRLSQNPGPWYYEMQELGFNYRMTDIQAALGIAQLRKLDQFVSRRAEIVSKYNDAFRNSKSLILPFERDGLRSAFHLYVLQVRFNSLGKTRKELMAILESKGVGTQVHYIPIHQQPYYRKHTAYELGDFPVAERYYDQALSIPLYPKMTNRDIDIVIETILEATHIHE